MSTAPIQKQLQMLCENSDDVYLSMMVSSDGFVIAYEGQVGEPDLFGAYFFELKRVTEKVLTGLDLGGVDEIYIRSKSGVVTLFPIFDKGYLACLSSVNMNAQKMQILAWKHLRKIYEAF